jgi:4-amino-4-deoxy-L-arabinose transferase-like glycosyltransferase
MASPAQIVALIFVILGLLSFINWWRRGFPKKKYPLWPFVLLILVVWAILLPLAWFTGSQAQFNEFVATCKGYLIGMLVMFIAMRAAGWKGGEK